MNQRFAILYHDGIPEPHFDLLIELMPGAPLATWRLPHWPVFEPTTATRLRDHRRAYLDYEGEISGGRGFARRVDAGTCVIVSQQPAEIIVGLEGVKLILRQVREDEWIAIGNDPASP